MIARSHQAAQGSRRQVGQQEAAPCQAGQQEAAQRQVVLALGSNLGDRLAQLQAGVDALAAEPGMTVLAVSAVFETSPVGGPRQPDYLNAVLIGRSALPARSILDACLATERAAGRMRSTVWGPRTLDIDVIACGEEISDDPELTLPHPRASQRAFVLAPWHDIDSQAWLPGAGAVARLLAEADQAGVRRREDLELRAGTRQASQPKIGNSARGDASRGDADICSRPSP